jgi:hypothetical protein
MTPYKYNNGKMVGWRTFGEINQVDRSRIIRGDQGTPGEGQGDTRLVKSRSVTRIEELVDNSKNVTSPKKIIKGSMKLPLEQIPEKSQEKSVILSSMKDLSSPLKSKNSLVRKNSTITPTKPRATNRRANQSKNPTAVA